MPIKRDFFGHLNMNLSRSSKLQSSFAMEESTSETHDVDTDDQTLDRSRVDHEEEEDWRGYKTAQDCLHHLFMCPTLSDVTITFASDKNVRFPAHKFILSMRSRVFEAMFKKTVTESEDEIQLDDHPNTFRLLLRYIYTDEIALDNSSIFHYLHVANKYSVSPLLEICKTYLEKELNHRNACYIHEKAVRYGLTDLEETAFQYILYNAEKVFGNADFYHLSRKSMKKILKSSWLQAAEIHVFYATVYWAENRLVRKEMKTSPHEIRAVMGSLLYLIRVPLIPVELFMQYVVPLKILTKREVENVYHYLSSGSSDVKVGPFSAQKRIGGRRANNSTPRSIQTSQYSNIVVKTKSGKTSRIM